MNSKKLIIYSSSILCLIMPVLSIEGIIPWIVCIFVMHKNIKLYREDEKINKIIANLLICVFIMIFYNVAGRVIQDILVRLWV